MKKNLLFGLVLLLSTFYTTAQTTISMSVVNSSDDAWEKNNGDMKISDQVIELGKEGSAGLRFQYVTIPAGATITAAHIQFVAKDDKDDNPSGVIIKGELYAYPNAFLDSDDNISSRSMTSAYVSWTFAGWLKDDSYNSPNIASVIQEIVNQGLWSIGNPLVLMLDATGSEERKAHSFDEDPLLAPKLFVTYTGGTPPGDVTDHVNNDMDLSATNEIQDLELNGNTLSLTQDNTPVDLSGYLDNTDTQDLSIDGTGKIISLTDGGSVTINADDADADPTNEYNTGVTLTGTDLNITDLGGTITTDLSSLNQSGAVTTAQNTANQAVNDAAQAQSSADNAQASANQAQNDIINHIADDLDTDATNEYNTNAQLNGTDLEITDGGGTKTVDLSSLANVPETDPKVGTLSNTKVPHWNDSELQDGIITDDGTKVDINGNINAEGDLYLKDGKVIDNDGFGRTQFYHAADEVKHMEFNGYNTYFQNKPVYIGPSIGIGLDPAIDLITAKFELWGDFKLVDGSQAAGRVLTSDVDGLASWQTPVDNVDDADNDPTNELQDWSNLPGIPADIADGDQVDDADADPTNEYNTGLELFGTSLQVFDNGGIQETDLSSLKDNLGNHSATQAIKLNNNPISNDGDYEGIFIDNDGHVGIAIGTSPNANLAVGGDALINNVWVGQSPGGSFSTRVGENALANNMANTNSAFGHGAMQTNTTGFDNTGLGWLSLRDNDTGAANTAVGGLALFQNTTGQNNSALGYKSGETVTDGGSITLLGSFADVSNGSLVNATAVGAFAKAEQSNTVILGDNADVGIGTGAPTAKLDVRGNIKIEDGTQAAGRVLTSDADGLASWQDVVDNVDDADNDPTNELQDWNSLPGIPGDLLDGDQVDDADSDATNEIQNLSISGDELSISSGNTITIPGLSYVGNLIPQNVQSRLDAGESPLQIYSSDNSLLDSLYSKTYAGGVIFYFNTATGEGMVARPEIVPGTQWGCFGQAINGADDLSVGAGFQNTLDIVTDCADTAIVAQLSLNYSHDGYDDWFLPSKDEMDLLLEALKNTGFSPQFNTYVWSSTEVGSTNAYRVTIPGWKYTPPLNEYNPMNSWGWQGQNKQVGANMIPVRKFAADESPMALHLAADMDLSAENELNTSITLNGTNLEITDAGGTLTANLSSLQDGIGTDDQSLSYDEGSHTLTLEDGGNVDLSNLANELETDPVFAASDAAVITATDIRNWNNDLVDDADNDASNEIQTLSISGNDLSISGAGGNTISLPTAPEVDPEVGSNVTNIVPVWNGTALVAGSIFSDNNTTSGFVSSAIGFDNDAIGDYAFAAGRGNSATGEYAIAMGQNTQATGGGSISLGIASVANQNGALAIGTGNNATSSGAIALGVANTASGNNSSASGFGNTASGGWSVATGRSNVASGAYASVGGRISEASGNYSFAFGNTASSTMSDAVAFGAYSKAWGSASIAMGSNAKTEGNNAIALGSATLATGGNSVAIGHISTASGYQSVAIGRNIISSGENSVAIGIGNNTTGGGSFASGSYNTVTSDGATALGYNNTASALFSTAMGQGITAANNGELHNSGDVRGASFISTSDERYKKNVNNISNGLEKVMQLQGVTYEYKDEFQRFEAEKGKEQIGFIAQDVQKVLPELVSGEGTDENYLGIRYGNLTAVLVEAVKEQQKQIEDQQAQITDRDLLIDELKNKLEDLTNKVNIILNSGSSNQEETLNERAWIEQNAPNPFLNDTKIAYYIPAHSKKAQIIFYDVQGKVIKATDIQETGKGVLTVKGGTLLAGTYFYKLVVDSQDIDTKKAVFME